MSDWFTHDKKRGLLRVRCLRLFLTEACPLKGFDGSSIFRFHPGMNFGTPAIGKSLLGCHSGQDARVTLPTCLWRDADAQGCCLAFTVQSHLAYRVVSQVQADIEAAIL